MLQGDFNMPTHGAILCKRSTQRWRADRRTHFFFSDICSLCRSGAWRGLNSSYLDSMCLSLDYDIIRPVSGAFSKNRERDS